MTKETASPFHSNDEADSTCAPIQKHGILGMQGDALNPVPDFNIENKQAVEAATNRKPESGWESDSEHLSKQASADRSKPSQTSVKDKSELSEEKKIWPHCWDSESESEMPKANNGGSQNKPSSEKEEGEASSESEREELSGLPSMPEQLSKASEELKSSEEQRHNYTKTEKHKSKAKKAKRKHKHKRRNSDRSSSQRVKTKKKRSKKKHQKPKETFHWQPPLEFGDEGDEDESLAQGKTIDPAQQGASNKALAELVKSTQLKSQNVDSKDYSEIIHDSSKESYSTSEVSKSGDESANMATSQELKLKSAQNKPALIALGQSGVNASFAQTEDQDDMEICTPEHSGDPNTEPPEPGVVDLPALTDIGKNGNQQLLPQIDQKTSGSSPSTLTPANQAGETAPGGVGVPVDAKWKPLKYMTVVQVVSAAPLAVKMNRPQEQEQEGKTQGLKIEIKSKNRVRPGSLFDEVRKTARLNQRPRNQDSSSEEGSPAAAAAEQTGSQKRSRSKSRSVSASRDRRRDRSRSSTHSRSRSWSSSYTSRYVHLAVFNVCILNHTLHIKELLSQSSQVPVKEVHYYYTFLFY